MSQPEERARFDAAHLRERVWRARWRLLGVAVVGAMVLFVVLASVSAASHVDAARSGAHPASATEPTSAGSPSPSGASTGDASSPSPASVSPAALSTTTAANLLATLPVRPALTLAGYNRTADFGRPWLDEDQNGCDTRDDILGRDLTAVHRSGACTVLTGVLISPYTGASLAFVRGVKTSSLVQIDHVVALGDAWQTGAQALTQAQREALANDPLELLAVDGRSNEQKSDKDASEWLPANAAFACTYVARQISVKATYSLWVTPAEHAAMAAVLSNCSGIMGIASPSATATNTGSAASAPVAAAPVVTPVAPTAPAPAPAPPVASTRIVHPGAFCAAADAGQHGVTAAGSPMVCETSSTDTRLRWRAG